MLARRFARFGWRLAHYQPHASTFRVTSALRQQSTASDSKTDGIIGRLATEKAESDLLSQQEHAQLNENIREVAKIFKNIQNREQLLDQAALQNAVTTITTRIRYFSFCKYQLIRFFKFYQKHQSVVALIRFFAHRTC